MFTIKYRTFQPCACQQEGAPTSYDEVEQIHGPFELICQSVEDGYKVVHAHRSEESPGTTFGPWLPPETAEDHMPRPTIWVMNDRGATVAKYDL